MSCQVLTSRKIYQVSCKHSQILTSCLLGWVGIFNHVSGTTEMWRPVEYFYNWSLKSWIFALETSLVSKTCCILSLNMLFVFVVDANATLSWVSICCGGDCCCGYCWCCCNARIAKCNEAKKSLTPGQNNIISPRVWLLRSKLESLCSEHVLSKLFSRQMLIGLINLKNQRWLLWARCP